MTYKAFAGIGARVTPIKIGLIMHSIAGELADKGYILRSGGASGADTFFEVGCDMYRGTKEIFLPWKGFNSSSSHLYEVSKKSLEMAEAYHPAWDRLGYAAKKLMARNCCQVLGENLDSPSKFVVCYTLDGKSSGGTGQALRIASDFKIPIYNLYDEELHDLRWLEEIDS